MPDQKSKRLSFIKSRHRYSDAERSMAINMQSTYRILGYQPTVNPAWRQKLLTMGLLPGAIIEIIRVAPMGDPVQIRTRRVSLAVRQRDLAAIILEEMA